MRNFTIIALSILFFVNFSLCAQKTSAPKSEDKECLQFCGQLEDCINRKGDPNFLKKNFDIDVFCERMLKGVKINPKSLADFKRGFMKGFNFAKELIKNNVRYKFMRIRKEKGKKYALFRMIHPKSGCNYHEMLLVERNGKIRVGDIYILLLGEFYSVTAGRTIVPALLRVNQNFIKKFFTKKPDFLKYSKEIKNLTALFKRGDFSGTLKAYKKLPASLQKDKMIFIYRFRAASAIGCESPEYSSMISDLQKFYPGDPCLNFIMIDTYFTNGKYGKVLKCIDNIKNFVGTKDAYLIFLEGNALMAQGKYQQAVKKQEQAIKTEPQLQEPYFALITIYLQQKNWKKVIDSIELAEKRLNLVFDNVESAPGYSEFVKSKEYKKWKNSRKAFFNK